MPLWRADHHRPGHEFDQSALRYAGARSHAFPRVLVCMGIASTFNWPGSGLRSRISRVRDWTRHLPSIEEKSCTIIYKGGSASSSSGYVQAARSLVRIRGHSRRVSCRRCTGRYVDRARPILSTSAFTRSRSWSRQSGSARWLLVDDVPRPCTRCCGRSREFHVPLHWAHVHRIVPA